MNRIKITFAIIFSSYGYIYAQQIQPADTSYWETALKGIFGINQSSFSNWQAGGENSLAFNTLMEVTADYDEARRSWQSRLKAGYGSTKQKSTGFRKTDDVLSFETKYGYKFVKSKPDWLWSTGINFLTQFADGYNYPNDSVKISTFMAPGYLLIDTGIEYRKGKSFSASLSPIAGKLTFVKDDTLAAAGAFGVEPGDQFRSELGTSFKLRYKKEIFKNVNYSAGVVLFTEYSEKFGNIDVFFTNLFVFKISDIFVTTITFDLIYDDDISIQQFDEGGNLTGEGPRLQYKQVLSLGLTLILPRGK